MYTNPLIENGPLRTREILNRIALPMLLFLTVLTAVLLISRWMLLPQWTQVSIAGKLLGPEEADAYKTMLETEVDVREASRLAIVLPIRDQDYTTLRDRRTAMPELHEIREQMVEAARRGSPEDAPDAVQINSVMFNADARTLTIGGDVGGVGPRSMTVLAYFTEVLGAIPFVETVTPPAFDRIEDPKAGFYSPFSITLTLKDGMAISPDHE